MRIILSILLLLLSFANCSDDKKKQKFVFPFISVLVEDEGSGPNGTTSGRGDVTLKEITVFPATNSIPLNESASYTATGIYSDDSKADITDTVTWSLGSGDVGDFEAKGRARGKGVGSTTVAASLNNLTGSASLSVTNKTVTSIQITAVPSIANGTSTQFTAVAFFSDGTTMDITNLADWSSSDAGRAGVNNGDSSKGLVTGASGGSANISASYGGVSGTRPINVTAVTLVSISVGGDISIGPGSSHKFTAIGTFSDGTTQNITQSVTWTSTNSGVATVNDTLGTNKGTASALSSGSTSISASLNGVTGSANLNVISATLVSLSIDNGGSNSMAQGTSKPLRAIATYSDGTTLDVTSSVAWSSANAGTASVSNASGTEGLVYGASTGAVPITASLGGVSASVTLNVESVTLTSIAITGPSTMEVGGTGSYTAIGTYSNGVTQNITSSVIWASSSTARAPIGNGDLNKGVAYGTSTGTTNITASLGGVTSNSVALGITNTTTSGSTTQTVAGYDVNLPSGTTTTTTPTGDFDGITYQGDPAEVAGFVSSVNYAGTPGCTNFGAFLLNSMASDTPDLINNWSQISAPVIGTNPNCSIVYDLALSTKTSTTVTGLSNHLISVIGASVPGGTVTGFPVSGASEQAATAFRVIIQATYSTTGAEIVAVGVSRADNYSANQSVITSLINGTSIVPAGSTILAKTDGFTGAADPKVDFVWVVDNSGSMEGEQESVINNSLVFFDKLNGKHLDFRLGVIATGSRGSSSNTMNPSGEKAWELWGTSQDGTKWVYKNDTSAANTFQGNVQSVTINGSGDESGIFFAERALGVTQDIKSARVNGGSNPVSPTIVKREGAKLIFVMLSDEGDGYNLYSNSAFNVSNNIFTQNDMRVYSIIGLHDGSLANSGVNLGEPGRCDSNPSNSNAPKATNSNNTNRNYFDLAAATGGSSASICTTDYSAILDNIATQAAAASSSYVLTKVPIASTIVVKNNGSVVPQDTTNGWQYNSSSNSIVFSGSAWPAAGANIEVSFSYLEGSGAMRMGEEQTLTAYLVKSAKQHTTAFGMGIAALAALALAGRFFLSRKED
jgi:hypothetical protein